MQTFDALSKPWGPSALKAKGGDRRRRWTALAIVDDKLHRDGRTLTGFDEMHVASILRQASVDGPFVCANACRV